jgi:hypothetical protein
VPYSYKLRIRLSRTEPRKFKETETVRREGANKQDWRGFHHSPFVVPPFPIRGSVDEWFSGGEGVGLKLLGGEGDDARVHFGSALGESNQ